jgi:hypothetical protein
MRWAAAAFVQKALTPARGLALIEPARTSPGTRLDVFENQPAQSFALLHIREAFELSCTESDEIAEDTFTLRLCEAALYTALRFLRLELAEAR